ncbi:ATP-binding protein, partial [Streptomyces sp. NPDC059866]|uniref:ATP-binding protein n=1 Tax=Streptomyces sp. NPDC059866 TaxID=3346978 RepID=UPI0036644EC9
HDHLQDQVLETVCWPTSSGSITRPRLRDEPLEDGALLVDVSDPVASLPAVPTDAPDRAVESGRGLFLVQQFASLCWFLRGDGGKTVRAQLPAATT